MEEYINIISKEEIFTCVQWPICVVAAISIIGMFVCYGIFLKTRKDSIINTLIAFAVGGVIGILVAGMICSIFFRIPTGKYEYEATIDAENMTVQQYEEFLDAYNPERTNQGTYKWRDN